MKRFLLFFVAALLFVSCDNKFEDEGNTIQRVSTRPTLTAEFAEEDTRTYVEDNTYLRWHEGDLISAFLGNTLNNKYIFKGDTGDNGGTFSAVSSTELGSSYPLDNIFALYPYDEDNEISKAGVISCTLPAVQKYAENSFGKGANTMVAVTKDLDDTFLSFKNACGYLKIKLYGKATVKSIELKGNNGEKIAGEASIAATYGGVPTVAMTEDATESITLDCGEGVKLSTDAEKPTEFWFVVPPTVFSDGLTIVATDTNGVTFVKSTSNVVTITRNEIQPMAAVEAIFPDPTPANNEIWYTSSDGEIVKPYSGYSNDYADALTTFGANIVSNNYKDGKGIISFDGDVTTIGKNAFFSCDSLTSVTIPDSVTTIGEWAFYKCSSLTRITIPDSVTTIGRSAFYECTSLTSVTIPDSVTTIGDYAFESCSNLTSVTIPDSVTTIGNEAFFGCDSLTSVTIGNSVTTIGDSAFYWCFSLTCVTIGDSVTTIGDYTFGYCDSLTSVTIPDSVTTIGGGAFSNCESLKEFKGKFAADNGRCLIVDGVLNSFAIGCGATEYTIPNSVTTIGNYAFVACDSLTCVTIGDSVTTIGEGAFARCTSLTNVTIPDSVTTIGYYAFYDCSSLTSVIIPDSVTTIGKYAFEDCHNLTSVYCKATTPPSLGNNAFQYYSNGRYFNIGCTIYVPRGCGWAYKSAPNWNDYAADIVEYDFETGEVVPESQPNNEIWYTSSDGKIVEQYSGQYNDYADALTTFGANIVSNTYKDGKGVITFDGDVTTIGDRAFFYCASLTSVTIPDSVTTIGNSAFHLCTSLTSVTIPDSVTTIGMMAFAYCYSLTSVTIGDSVTTIGNSAFDSCTRLTSVTIPDSVTKIGRYAFYYCTSLKEFKGKFASDNGRCLIVDGVLNSFAIGCGATEYTIPDSVTTIGDSAFYWCNSLTSVTIPDSVTTIGNSAFWACDSLTSVTIPDSVTTIGYAAFAWCDSLTSVTIGDSVTTIGERAFEVCTSLKEFKGKFASDNGRCLIVDGVLNSFAIGCGATEYTIPDSVTTIGDDAFRDCYSLTSVTIPDSVTKIGSYAFYYCTSLKSVYCKATTPPSLGDYAFKYYSNWSYINIGCTIYVPRGCGSAYKLAPKWSEYAADIVEYDF